MKLTIALLAAAMVGVIAGAALIARWAVGVAIIADCIALGVYAWNRDVPDVKTDDQPTIASVPDVLERARRSS